MKKTKIVLSMMLASSVASFTANAHDGLYFGVSAGGTNWNDLESELKESTGVDDASFAWGAFIGFNTLSPYVDVEVGYKDLGKANLLDVEGDYTAQLINATAKFKGEVAEDFFVFGKVGTHWYDWDANGDGVLSDDNGWGPHVGLGIEAALQKNWSLAFEYTWYDDVGGTEIHYLGLSAMYHWYR